MPATTRRRSPEEQLAAAIQQRKAAEAREKRLKAKMRTQSERNRTRQMILLGVAVAAEMGADSAFAAQVKGILHKHTVRDHDRAVLADYLS